MDNTSRRVRIRQEKKHESSGESGPRNTKQPGIQSKSKSQSFFRKIFLFGACGTKTKSVEVHQSPEELHLTEGAIRTVATKHSGRSGGEHLTRNVDESIGSSNTPGTFIEEFLHNRTLATNIRRPNTAIVAEKTLVNYFNSSNPDADSEGTK